MELELPTEEACRFIENEIVAVFFGEKQDNDRVHVRCKDGISFGRNGESGLIVLGFDSGQMESLTLAGFVSEMDRFTAIVEECPDACAPPEPGSYFER